MKTIMQSLFSAFSMYSRIPVPNIQWSKDSMRYAMCFFPWVGAVIGLLEYLCFLPYQAGVFGALLYAAVAVTVPVAVTGAIHLDGFMDTCDALSSWRSREERLRIMKDSHTGAKAVIWVCIYFLLAFGLASEVTETLIVPLCMIFPLARTYSAYSVFSPYFPKANPEGTLAAFSDTAEKKTVRVVCLCYLVLIAVLMIFTGGLPGVCICGTGLASFFLYRHICMKYFGGTTGDLAGFFVTYSELLMLAAGVIAAAVCRWAAV